MLVKTLEIENRQLGIFRALLTVGFLAVGGIQFYTSSHYALTVDAAPSMWINVEALPPQDYVVNESLRSYPCSDPNSEFKCAPWCSPALTRDIYCLATWDTFIQQSEKHVLLTTFMTQILLPTPAYTFPFLFDQWWVPAVEFFNISIRYGFNADISRNSDSQFVVGPTRVTGSSVGSDGTGLTTVVLDSQGKVWRTFPPGSLTLSFRDVAYLIGHESILDAPNTLADAELLPGSENRTRRPPIRKTGTQIELVVFCSSRDPTQQVEWQRVWTAQPQKCTLKARQMKTSAEKEEKFDFIGGATVARQAYGIGITGITQGEFEFPCVSETLSNLVVFLVFLSFPTKIIRFFAMHCLGDLSRIYRGVLVQKFSIRDEVASKVVRLASESVTYAALDTSSQEREENSVTTQCLIDRMQVALSSMQCLDKSEVGSMARFSLRRLAERDQQCCTDRRGILGRMKRLWSLRTSGWTSATSHPESVSAQNHVSMASLLGAESSADPIRIQALATLFDKDRKVSFVERCFTPTSLWNSIHVAKMATDVEHRAEVPRNFVGCSVADDLENGNPSALQQRAQATELRPASAVAQNLADDLEKGNPSPLQKRLEATELRLAAAEKQIYALQSQRHEFEAILDNINMKLQHLHNCSDNLGSKSKPGVSSIGSSSASQAYNAPHSPSAALPSAEGNRSLSISTAPLATSSTTVLSQGPHTWADASEPLAKLLDIQAEVQDDMVKLSARVKRLEQGSELPRETEKGLLGLQALSMGGSRRDSTGLGDPTWNEVDSRKSGAASGDAGKSFLIASSARLEHVEDGLWALEHRVESLLSLMHEGREPTTLVGCDEQA